jgi:hypothetical protein
MGIRVNSSLAKIQYERHFVHGTCCWAQMQSLQVHISKASQANFASLCATAQAHFVGKESVSGIMHALLETASRECNKTHWAAEALEAMRRCISLNTAALSTNCYSESLPINCDTAALPINVP